VLAGGRGGRALQRPLDTVGDEVEGRAALHLERRPRMVGEDEDRTVIGRRVAPPALPALVGPGPAHRPEHVAAQDPGPDIGEAALRERVVDAGRAALLARHRVKGAGREEPAEQSGPAHPERVLQSLVRPGAVAVEREAKALDAQLAHGFLFLPDCSFAVTPRRTARSRPRTCAWHRTAWSWGSCRRGADPASPQ